VQAVRAQTGCLFLDDAIALGTLLSIGGAAYGAVGPIIGAVQILAPGSHTAPAGRIAAIKQISGGLNDIKSAYQDLKTQFQPRSVQDLDFTKLAIKQEEYDTFLDTYRTLPAAMRLKDLVDTYFDKNQQRNQRLLDYTASFSNEDKLRGQIDDLKHQEDQLSNDLVRVGDQAALTMSAQTFMGATYLRAKQIIRKVLWNKRKAIEYATLEEVDFSVNDMNMAALRAKNTTLNDILGSFKEEAHTRYIPFPVTVQLLVVQDQEQIKHLDTQHLNLPYISIVQGFQKLTTGQQGTLQFAIPLDCPAFTLGWSCIRLSGLDIRLLGVTVPDGYGPPRISIDAIHCGVSQIINAKRKVKWYIHTPVIAPITYDIGQANYSDALKNNLVGDRGQYMGVSPLPHGNFGSTSTPAWPVPSLYYRI
jgi:hypothetical protein